MASKSVDGSCGGGGGNKRVLSIQSHVVSGCEYNLSVLDVFQSVS